MANKHFLDQEVLVILLSVFDWHAFLLHVRVKTCNDYFSEDWSRKLYVFLFARLLVILLMAILSWLINTLWWKFILEIARPFSLWFFNIIFYPMIKYSNCQVNCCLLITDPCPVCSSFFKSYVDYPIMQSQWTYFALLSVTLTLTTIYYIRWGTKIILNPNKVIFSIR